MNNTENPNESLNQIIGKRIRNVIKLKGLTQKEVAEQIFYKETSFSDMLAGKKGISQENLVKLSKILGCSTDYFLGLNDYPSKDPSVTKISEYTGLSTGAIERLHTFKDPECFKQYYRIPSPDPRFPDYTEEKIREEFGDDKLYLSLLEPKSIVWLSNFIAHNTTSLKIENEFISYILELARKMEFDAAQKEMLHQLEENPDSKELNQLYDQVILHQENCTGHLDSLKESISSDFSDFCNWYFKELEKQAEQIYLKNAKESTSSDK